MIPGEYGSSWELPIEAATSTARVFAVRITGIFGLGTKAGAIKGIITEVRGDALG